MGRADGAILVSQTIRRLIAGHHIAAARPIEPAQVQPSSLDLRVGARIWQLQCSFVPGAEGIASKLERLATSLLRDDPDDPIGGMFGSAQLALPSTASPDDPIVLHQGGIYLAEIEEALSLPDDVHGRANPKSSTGRLDVFVRVLTETGYAFDTIPAGYRGRLYLEITPQSFHVAIRRGDTLAQLRLARGNPLLSADELGAVQAKGRDGAVCLWSDGSAAPVIETPTPGVLLSIDLESTGGPVGYMARRHQPAIDLRRRDLPVDRYWNRLYQADQGQILEPEDFYIFATRERLRIPPELCAELVAFDATKGELRTHYAGFIDSGFGWSPAGHPISGARLVLEIRTRDVPFLLEHGQPLFRVEVLRNEARPDVLYGDAGSHYQAQGLRLAKQFKGM